MDKYRWIRQIPASLMKWDDVPLLGDLPSFPWEQFAGLLSETLQIEAITIKPGEVEWKPRSEYTSGFANPLITYLTSGSVDGDLAWVMERDDLLKVMNYLLLRGEERSLIEEELQREFHRFLVLELLHLFAKVDFDPALSLHLCEEGKLPEEAALSYDISLSIEESVIKGRLLLSTTFRRSFAARHSPKTPDAYLKDPLADTLQLDLHLQAGYVDISKEDWEGVSPGDLLLLDSCGVDPERNEGVVFLTLHGVPYFQGALKEGRVEILDSATRK